MDKIPFSILPEQVLSKYSKYFMGLSEAFLKTFKFLNINLKKAEYSLNGKEYLSRVFISLIFLFIVLGIAFPLVVFAKSENNWMNGVLSSLVICFLVFINQLNYPKIRANKRVKEIEKNLLSSLRTILIQINSGVSLFDSLIYISRSDYGEISKVFSVMVKRVNTGTSQIKALEEISEANPSPFFRKAIWQLINGMKAGSDISKVLEEIIDSLSSEQIIQIETYGSQLNPLAMFYMLIVIIVPSLGVTFITVMSSFFSSANLDNKTVLIGLFIIVFIFQIIFLGMIRTKRPSLLED